VVLVNIGMVAAARDVNARSAKGRFGLWISGRARMGTC
jgi:hypothetical protein